MTVSEKDLGNGQTAGSPQLLNDGKADAPAIAERIDRLPLGWEIGGLLLLAGVAWLIESYDIGIIGNVLPLLQHQYSLNTTMVGLLAVASTVGIVAAVIPAGWVGDRIGRKAVLIGGTTWYASFTLLCGLAPTLPAILALRFVAGLGMGAVFPIPYALAAELTPRRFRGAAVGILDAFLSIGYFAAPLVAFFAVPRVAPELGWRLLFIVGGLPLLYVPALVRWLPESPRWLQSKGRVSEADQIVCRLEDAIERRIGRPLPTPRATTAATPSAQTSMSDIFRGTYRKRTLMMWIAFPCLMFVFYAVQTYTPTVLLKEGFALNDAFLLTALIVAVSIPGKFAEALAVERLGRKATIISFGAVSAVSACLFGLSHDALFAIGFGILLSVFGIGVDPALKVYGAEQYPTAVRETGVGLIEGVGRLLGGVLAPFTMAFVLNTSGIVGSYLFVAAVALIGVLAVAALGEETKGRSLESISAGLSLAVAKVGR